MTETPTLVERLRETSDDWPACLVKLEQEAADRIEQLERELAEARKVYSAERHHLRTVNENLIRHLSHIHGLVHPDYIALPDGRKMKFHPPDELVREAWEGLSKAIREIPQVIDAVRAGQSKED